PSTNLPPMNSGWSLTAGGFTVRGLGVVAVLMASPGSGGRGLAAESGRALGRRGGRAKGNRMAFDPGGRGAAAPGGGERGGRKEALRGRRASGLLDVLVPVGEQRSGLRSWPWPSSGGLPHQDLPLARDRAVPGVPPVGPGRARVRNLKAQPAQVPG